MNLNNRATQPNPATLPADGLICAVIDEQGREVPITEAMIQQACRALDPISAEDDPARCESQISLAPSARTCAANPGA
ncbi:MAG TPA: hypothetical protein VL178_06500 [Pseudomonas sp.]|nr:hypothetical protein [Pseudomonas sp.]